MKIKHQSFLFNLNLKYLQPTSEAVLWKWTEKVYYNVSEPFKQREMGKYRWIMKLIKQVNLPSRMKGGKNSAFEI